MLNYLKFIDIALKISDRLPDYSSRYSRKDFTQKQLFVLFLLKQKSKLSYDNFVDDFSTRDSAMVELGLRKVPRASTLKMFVKRINYLIFEIILSSCVNLTRGGKINTAIDSTGFQLEDGSYSYLKRLGLSTKKRKNLKLSVVVNTNDHLFLAGKPRKGKAHDNKDFKPLLNKTLRNTKRKIRTNTSDKGYDDEKNHEFAESRGFENIAPVRKKTKQHYRIHGEHRKRLARKFPKKKYHRRSIIENMFFCVKRLCGKVIFAKKWFMQKKEVMGKIIAYNVHRLAQILEF